MGKVRVYIPTIMKCTDGTETMASLYSRITGSSVYGCKVLLDTSSISTTPQLYRCEIFIDPSANEGAGIVRIRDQVTGKLYVGKYSATETLASVLSKAVDTDVAIIVTAATLDDVTVTGQTVYLYEGNAAKESKLIETCPYNGTPISFMVSRGFEYFVRISSNLVGHFVPTTAHGVAIGTQLVTLTYQDVGNISSYDGLIAIKNTIYNAGYNSAYTTKYDEVYAEVYAAAIAEGKTEQEADAEATEAATAAAVDAGRTAGIAELRAALIGTAIPDTYTHVTFSDAGVVTGTTTYAPTQNEDGTYVAGTGYPWRVVNAKMMEDGEGNVAPRLIMQAQFATVETVPVDPREQNVATEENAQSGVDYYGFSVTDFSTNSTYAVGKFVKYDGQLWRCKTAVSTAGGWTGTTNWENHGSAAITNFSTSDTYSERDFVIYDDGTGARVWRARSNVSTPGDWGGYEIWQPYSFDTLEADLIGPLAVSVGDSLSSFYSQYWVVYKTSLKASDVTRVKNVIRYGLNRYSTGTQREWLLADDELPGWHTQQHIGQIAPSQNYTMRGYQAGLGDIKEYAVPVKITAYTNPYTDGGVVDEMCDKFWLPSGTEMIGNVNANEGTPFGYYFTLFCEGIEASGRTVRHYNSYEDFRYTDGEEGVAYVADDTCYFYYWRGDTNAYVNVTNDDRGVDNAKKATSTEHYSSLSSFPVSGTTNTVAYYADDTHKVYRWTGSAYADMSAEYYSYAATGGLIAHLRRQLAVSNKAAVHCRLRSASRGSSANAWYVTSSGHLYSHYNAVDAYSAAPACAI